MISEASFMISEASFMISEEICNKREAIYIISAACKILTKL